MHIRDKRRSGERRPGAGGGAALLLSFLAVGATLAGCASPGPPLPPTLNLPQVVPTTGLTAVRVGGAVRLDWTTPTQTTDKLAIKGPVTAVICRDAVGANASRIPAKTPCAAVARVNVTAGASEAMDTLPAELTAGSARLLAYRVELLNAAGRTAGPSAAVFAVAGAAPAAVEGFAGHVTKAGVVLEWKREEQGTESVALERTTLNALPAAAGKQAGLPGESRQTPVTRFRAGPGAGSSGDAGGAIDRTAETGREYSYTAQRVQVETIGGQTLESRSAVSAALTFTVQDVFPPGVPRGLVAVPGFAGTEQKPAIDLSWEPDVEPRVAGYRVYRREALEDNSDRWEPITPELVTGAAYRDATVAAGHRYGYRVTAVSTAGNESGPSGAAMETAP
jgi:hypothetical protein